MVARSGILASPMVIPSCRGRPLHDRRCERGRDEGIQLAEARRIQIKRTPCESQTSTLAHNLSTLRTSTTPLLPHCRWRRSSPTVVPGCTWCASAKPLPIRLTRTCLVRGGAGPAPVERSRASTDCMLCFGPNRQKEKFTSTHQQLMTQRDNDVFLLRKVRALRPRSPALEPQNSLQPANPKPLALAARHALLASQSSFCGVSVADKDRGHWLQRGSESCTYCILCCLLSAHAKWRIQLRKSSRSPPASVSGRHAVGALLTGSAFGEGVPEKKACPETSSQRVHRPRCGRGQPGPASDSRPVEPGREVWLQDGDHQPCARDCPNHWRTVPVGPERQLRLTPTKTAILRRRHASHRQSAKIQHAAASALRS